MEHTPPHKRMLDHAAAERLLPGCEVVPPVSRLLIMGMTLRVGSMLHLLCPALSWLPCAAGKKVVACSVHKMLMHAKSCCSSHKCMFERERSPCEMFVWAYGGDTCLFEI